MSELLFELPLRSAVRTPEAVALRHRGATTTYAQLATAIDTLAGGLVSLGLQKLERVAIYLPKRLETVAGYFGTVRAGGVFVPVNPLLKPPQVAHILGDCNARVLITSSDRLRDLAAMPELRSLRAIVTVDEEAHPGTAGDLRPMQWSQLLGSGVRPGHRLIDMDMCAILYTSGSTGRPKGVVLSHRNMVTGAESVAQYLDNRPQDRLLAALPFSFDYGFSQLSTAFHVGASVTLIDYLFARDIIGLLEQDQITGLAGVPPLWAQLVDLQWPLAVAQHLRYITNSGGAMPAATLQKLRRALPRTQVFLMYGLTEAFRSTYLDPAEVDRRPDSIGKAIPNAEILVVRPDGTQCEADEPGELVHRGSLVAMDTGTIRRRLPSASSPCRDRILE